MSIHSIRMSHKFHEYLHKPTHRFSKCFLEYNSIIHRQETQITLFAVAPFRHHCLQGAVVFSCGWAFFGPSRSPLCSWRGCSGNQRVLVGYCLLPILRLTRRSLLGSRDHSRDRSGDLKYRI